MFLRAFLASEKVAIEHWTHYHFGYKYPLMGLRINFPQYLIFFGKILLPFLSKCIFLMPRCDFLCCRLISNVYFFGCKNFLIEILYRHASFLNFFCLF